MRFNRLDILRYGALTDRSLVFRPGARLHVIYGPNEAGKSSALSAISDLLFGFPAAAEMSFLHDAASLRVGAEIVARDGQTLAFRRRRGRKNTLLSVSEAEEALPEDALSLFLGTLSRDVFQRAFGLDSDMLRSGGETMLKSGGEIGSLLFSAASGLTGLSGLRKSLDAEADGIYAPRRSKDRSFYQALDAHDEARRAERDNELKSGDWKALLKEQAEIEAELGAVLSERETTKRKLDRLRRMIRLEPVLREIDRERAQLAEYQSLATLPPGFGDELAKALDAARGNDDGRRAVEADIARLREEIEGQRVDGALLAALPKILAAHAERGAYLKAREDMARVRGEVDDFDQRLIQAARRLGFARLEDLEGAQPADADLVHLRDLVDRGSELDRGLKQLRQRIEEERDALHKLEADVAKGRLIDPKPWADRLSALGPEISELSGIEALKVRVTRAESDLAAAAGRLDPPVRDVASLLGAPLPDIATLTHHRHLIEAARAASAIAVEKLHALRQEADANASSLAALESGGRVVSREDLATARVRRDALVDTLGNKPSPAGLAEIKTAVAEADALSDDALANAERVSQHAELTSKRRGLERSIAAAEAVAREAAIAASDAATEFEDLFHAVPVTPSAPDGMIEWRRAVAGISALATALDDARDALETLRLKADAVTPALRTLAEAIGIAADDMPPTALARVAERRIADITERWTEKRSLERLRAAAEETLTRLELREAEMRKAVEDRRAQFSQAAVLAGLAEEAGIDMALAALDIWRIVPGLLAERENRDRRVRGMARDMQHFEDEVGAICAQTAAQDLASLPADAAVAMLHDRAGEARAVETRRLALAATLDRAELALAERIRDAGTVAAELKRLGETASKPEPELSAVLHALRERGLADAALRQSRQRFSAQADGAGEEEMRAELSGFDRVAADLEIEQLEVEDNSQVDRISVLRTAEADNQRRRRELETGMGAERAVFQKLGAEEEARDLARRWVVLKLAAGLLANSMEAYRERQADPVMRRAGQIFAELTGGRFQRLLQLYDEQDELRLAVERRTGEQVPLSGLSEGTGDQLYLALRLAFLEDYCSRNEPAPLILDDIFQTFDDERTAAGIRTLASAGDRFQTILFTHQMSLVETARTQIGDALDLIVLER